MSSTNWFSAPLIAAVAIATCMPAAAYAHSRSFDLPAQDAASGLRVFARQAGIQVTMAGREADGHTTNAVYGMMAVDKAMDQLLLNTGLTVHSFDGETAVLTAEQAFDAIVVTGSRVIRDGYDAPTPTTVLSEKEIQRDGSVNVADYLLKMPAFNGSVSNNGSTTSAGLVGISALSLRNLTPQRTLVLLDGQRLPAATLGDHVDINAIPNGIIKRVDVVTGGASAAWGSDAVAGVVNFVIDKEFTGVKGEVSGGITHYGDNENYKASLTAGTRFSDGRGHLMVSGESSYNAGVKHVPRDWYKGFRRVVNPAYAAGNGQPYIILADNAGPRQVAPGAVVTAGPLNGLVFGEGGQTFFLNEGAYAPNAAYMVGGDWEVGDWHNDTQNMQVPLSHQNLFARASYDITDKVNIYAQFMYGRSYSDADTTPYYQYGGLVIQRDNAFLPQAVGEAMDAHKLSSLNVGTWNEVIGALRFRTEKELTRYTLGASGNFDLLNRDWSWSAYATRNESRFTYKYDVPIMANYRRAIDAVMGDNGAPVCRSTLTNPNDGCAPFNILGTGVATQAGLNYVMGVAELDAKITQNLYSASVNGDPFSTWAGPVSVAFGIDHRRESADGVSDELSQQRAYWAGNYNPLRGSYHVTEVFGEIVVPLLSESRFGKSLELSGAIRYADYSTSGGVAPWKLGVTYTPIEDITLRATRSRDIRAGGLSTLFQPGQVLTQALFNPWTGTTDTTQYTTYGNTSIAPEKADTTVIGVIFRPRFVSGLTFSADYWDIDIKDAITTISPTALIDGCYTGLFPAYCDGITRNQAGTMTAISLSPVNLAFFNARGIDFELGYRHPVGNGEFSLRAFATHALKQASKSGLPGASEVSSLGQNNSAPRWRYNITAAYTDGSFEGAITARGISAGVYSTNYVECTSGCPDRTAANDTISENDYAGAVYLDLSLSYQLNSALQGFLTVTNLADKDPVAVAQGIGVSNPQWGILPGSYDYLGRAYRMGVRFNF